MRIVINSKKSGFLAIGSRPDSIDETIYSVKVVMVAMALCCRRRRQRRPKSHLLWHNCTHTRTHAHTQAAIHFRRNQSTAKFVPTSWQSNGYLEIILIFHFYCCSVLVFAFIDGRPSLTAQLPFALPPSLSLPHFLSFEHSNKLGHTELPQPAWVGHKRHFVR